MDIYHKHFLKFFICLKLFYNKMLAKSKKKMNVVIKIYIDALDL